MVSPGIPQIRNFNSCPRKQFDIMITYLFYCHWHFKGFFKHPSVQPPLCHISRFPSLHATYMLTSPMRPPSFNCDCGFSSEVGATLTFIKVTTRRSIKVPHPLPGKVHRRRLLSASGRWEVEGACLMEEPSATIMVSAGGNGRRHLVTPFPRPPAPRAQLVIICWASENPSFKKRFRCSVIDH